MPKSNFNMRGGQRRTYECSCGYKACGDVRSANFKIKLHNKVCKDTDKEMVKNFEPPPFNNINAYQNGMNGMRGGHLATKQVGGLLNMNNGETIGVRIHNKDTNEKSYIYNNILENEEKI